MVVRSPPPLTPTCSNNPEHIYFHEYFHGDKGAGLGASHQTGWTGLVARMIQLCAEMDEKV